MVRINIRAWWLRRRTRCFIRAPVFWVLFVFGGCALHAVPFAEPVVGHAMVWEEPSAPTPDRAPEKLVALVRFIGDGSESACRHLRETVIAQAEQFSKLAAITIEDAQATLEKGQPSCAPVILSPASPMTANFTIALGRRGLLTNVIGWRADLACRDWLARNDLSAKLQCTPAFLIQVPSRVSMKRASAEEGKR